MMALFIKQDFAPPIFSRRWLAVKFRPNMLIYNREHIISILESGLLFREDSVEVEQEAPDSTISWQRAGGCTNRWFTKGERNIVVAATIALLVASPPRNLQRSSLLKLASYFLLPIAIRATHRIYCKGSLNTLLCIMRDYMSLVRRATACCREYATLHAKLASVTTIIESTQAMLLQQQTSLLLLMSRAGSSLLGNVPWLRGDVTCDFDSDNLMKVHHAFLVVQSTLLKNIALAHSVPTAHILKIYKNHNERIYWIHNVLITHLTVEFKENFEALERMYRLLKNIGTKDTNGVKKLGTVINDTWLYSDVHTNIARSCLEMRVALEKCSHLDMFLDACAMNKEQINLEVLDKDIDEIIDEITKCLRTVQNSQIRLKKMQNKFKNDDDIKNDSDKEYEEKVILKIDDKEPEIKDEVFYFVKTEDESLVSPVGDILTGPGKREKETSKVVLKELKRKLVKREDLMRERERQALAKTMPELKNIPEFPRQINYEEYVDKKGLISKLNRDQSKNKKIFAKYKICKRRKRKFGNFKLKIEKYEIEDNLPEEYYEANAKLDVKSKFLTLKKLKNAFIITEWQKKDKNAKYDSLSSDFSETLSDTETKSNENQNRNKLQLEDRNFKFSKKDLELSPSSSESDSENINKLALLNDVRKYRAVRKKNYPKRPSIDNVDESLKPIKYSFGTGLAMASVLQVNSQAKLPNMVQEEVFIGNGEVSTDSGNDEDA